MGRKADGNHKITDKQKRFVEEYLIDFNATQAAIRAGYSKNAASETGYENLRKPQIQEAIQKAQKERSERTEVAQDDVIKGLLEVIGKGLGKIKVVETEIAKDEDGSIYGVNIEKVKHEPHAVNKALELLGKHLGMFKEKVEVSHQVSDDILEQIAVTAEKSRLQSIELSKKLDARKEA